MNDFFKWWKIKITVVKANNLHKIIWHKFEGLLVEFPSDIIVFYELTIS